VAEEGAAGPDPQKIRDLATAWRNYGATFGGLGTTVGRVATANWTGDANLQAERVGTAIGTRVVDIKNSCDAMANSLDEIANEVQKTIDQRAAQRTMELISAILAFLGVVFILLTPILMVFEGLGALGAFLAVIGRAMSVVGDLIASALSRLALLSIPAAEAVGSFVNGVFWSVAVSFAIQGGVDLAYGLPFRPDPINEITNALVGGVTGIMFGGSRIYGWGKPPIKLDVAISDPGTINNIAGGISIPRGDFTPAAVTGDGTHITPPSELPVGDPMIPPTGTTTPIGPAIRPPSIAGDDIPAITSSSSAVHDFGGVSAPPPSTGLGGGRTSFPGETGTLGLGGGEPVHAISASGGVHPTIGTPRVGDPTLIGGSRPGTPPVTHLDDPVNQLINPAARLDGNLVPPHDLAATGGRPASPASHLPPESARTNLTPHSPGRLTPPGDGLLKPPGDGLLKPPNDLVSPGGITRPPSPAEGLPHVGNGRQAPSEMVPPGSTSRGAEPLGPSGSSRAPIAESPRATIDPTQLSSRPQAPVGGGLRRTGSVGDLPSELDRIESSAKAPEPTVSSHPMPALETVESSSMAAAAPTPARRASSAALSGETMPRGGRPPEGGPPSGRSGDHLDTIVFNADLLEAKLRGLHLDTRTVFERQFREFAERPLIADPAPKPPKAGPEAGKPPASSEPVTLTVNRRDVAQSEAIFHDGVRRDLERLFSAEAGPGRTVRVRDGDAVVRAHAERLPDNLSRDVFRESARRAAGEVAADVRTRHEKSTSKALSPAGYERIADDLRIEARSRTLGTRFGPEGRLRPASELNLDRDPLTEGGRAALARDYLARADRELSIEREFTPIGERFEELAAPISKNMPAGWTADAKSSLLRSFREQFPAEPTELGVKDLRDRVAGDVELHVGLDHWADRQVARFRETVPLSDAGYTTVKEELLAAAAKYGRLKPGSPESAEARQALHGLQDGFDRRMRDQHQADVDVAEGQRLIDAAVGRSGISRPWEQRVRAEASADLHRQIREAGADAPPERLARIREDWADALPARMDRANRITDFARRFDDIQAGWRDERAATGKPHELPEGAVASIREGYETAAGKDVAAWRAGDPGAGRPAPAIGDRLDEHAATVRARLTEAADRHERLAEVRATAAVVERDFADISAGGVARARGDLLDAVSEAHGRGNTEAVRAHVEGYRARLERERLFEAEHGLVADRVDPLLRPGSDGAEGGHERGPAELARVHGEALDRFRTAIHRSAADPAPAMLSTLRENFLKDLAGGTGRTRSLSDIEGVIDRGVTRFRNGAHVSDKDIEAARRSFRADADEMYDQTWLDLGPDARPADVRVAWMRRMDSKIGESILARRGRPADADASRDRLAGNAERWADDEFARLRATGPEHLPSPEGFRRAQADLVADVRRAAAGLRPGEVEPAPLREEIQRLERGFPERLRAEHRFEEQLARGRDRLDRAVRDLVAGQPDLTPYAAAIRADRVAALRAAIHDAGPGPAPARLDRIRRQWRADFSAEFGKTALVIRAPHEFDRMVQSARGRFDPEQPVSSRTSDPIRTDFEAGAAADLRAWRESASGDRPMPLGELAEQLRRRVHAAQSALDTGVRRDAHVRAERDWARATADGAETPISPAARDRAVADHMDEARATFGESGTGPRDRFPARLAREEKIEQVYASKVRPELDKRPATEPGNARIRGEEFNDFRDRVLRHENPSSLDVEMEALYWARDLDARLSADRRLGRLHDTFDETFRTTVIDRVRSQEHVPEAAAAAEAERMRATTAALHDEAWTRMDERSRAADVHRAVAEELRPAVAGAADRLEMAASAEKVFLDQNAAQLRHFGPARDAGERALRQSELDDLRGRLADRITGDFEAVWRDHPGEVNRPPELAGGDRHGTWQRRLDRAGSDLADWMHDVRVQRMAAEHGPVTHATTPARIESNRPPWVKAETRARLARWNQSLETLFTRTRQRAALERDLVLRGYDTDAVFARATRAWQERNPDLAGYLGERDRQAIRFGEFESDMNAIRERAWGRRGDRVAASADVRETIDTRAAALDERFTEVARGNRTMTRDGTTPAPRPAPADEPMPADWIGGESSWRELRRIEDPRIREAAAEMFRQVAGGLPEARGQARSSLPRSLDEAGTSFFRDVRRNVEQASGTDGGTPREAWQGARDRMADDLSLAQVAEYAFAKAVAEPEVFAKEMAGRTAYIKALARPDLDSLVSKLTPEQLARVQDTFRAELRLARDETWTGPPGEFSRRHDSGADVNGEWNYRADRIATSLPARIRREPLFSRSTVGAAAEFESIMGARANVRGGISEAAYDALAARFREDYVIARHELYGVGESETRAWLGHEAAHENRFTRGLADMAEVNPVTARPWDAPFARETVDAGVPTGTAPLGRDDAHLIPDDFGGVAPWNARPERETAGAGGEFGPGQARAMPEPTPEPEGLAAQFQVSADGLAESFGPRIRRAAQAELGRPDFAAAFDHELGVTSRAMHGSDARFGSLHSLPAGERAAWRSRFMADGDALFERAWEPVLRDNLPVDSAAWRQAERDFATGFQRLRARLRLDGFHRHEIGRHHDAVAQEVRNARALGLSEHDISLGVHTFARDVQMTVDSLVARGPRRGAGEFDPGGLDRWEAADTALRQRLKAYVYGPGRDSATSLGRVNQQVNDQLDRWLESTSADAPPIDSLRSEVRQLGQSITGEVRTRTVESWLRFRDSLHGADGFAAMRQDLDRSLAQVAAEHLTAFRDTHGGPAARPRQEYQQTRDFHTARVVDDLIATLRASGSGLGRPSVERLVSEFRDRMGAVDAELRAELTTARFSPESVKRATERLEASADTIAADIPARIRYEERLVGGVAEAGRRYFDLLGDSGPIGNRTLAAEFGREWFRRFDDVYGGEPLPGRTVDDLAGEVRSAALGHRGDEPAWPMDRVQDTIESRPAPPDGAAVRTAYGLYLRGGADGVPTGTAHDHALAHTADDGTVRIVVGGPDVLDSGLLDWYLTDLPPGARRGVILDIGQTESVSRGLGLRLADRYDVMVEFPGREIVATTESRGMLGFGPNGRRAPLSFADTVRVVPARHAGDHASENLGLRPHQDGGYDLGDDWHLSVTRNRDGAPGTFEIKAPEDLPDPVTQQVRELRRDLRATGLDARGAAPEFTVTVRAPRDVYTASFDRLFRGVQGIRDQRLGTVATRRAVDGSVDEFRAGTRDAHLGEGTDPANAEVIAELERAAVPDTIPELSLEARVANFLREELPEAPAAAAPAHDIDDAALQARWERLRRDDGRPSDWLEDGRSDRYGYRPIRDDALLPTRAEAASFDHRLRAAFRDRDLRRVDAVLEELGRRGLEPIGPAEPRDAVDIPPAVLSDDEFIRMYGDAAGARGRLDGVPDKIVREHLAEVDRTVRAGDTKAFAQSVHQFDLDLFEARTAATLRENMLRRARAAGVPQGEAAMHYSLRDRRMADGDQAGAVDLQEKWIRRIEGLEFQREMRERLDAVRRGEGETGGAAAPSRDPAGEPRADAPGNFGAELDRRLRELQLRNEFGVELDKRLQEAQEPAKFTPEDLEAMAAPSHTPELPLSLPEAPSTAPARSSVRQPSSAEINAGLQGRLDALRRLDDAPEGDAGPGAAPVGSLDELRALRRPPRPPGDDPSGGGGSGDGGSGSGGSGSSHDGAPGAPAAPGGETMPLQLREPEVMEPPAPSTAHDSRFDPVVTSYDYRPVREGVASPTAEQTATFDAGLTAARVDGSLGRMFEWHAQLNQAGYRAAPITGSSLAPLPARQEAFLRDQRWFAINQTTSLPAVDAFLVAVERAVRTADRAAYARAVTDLLAVTTVERQDHRLGDRVRELWQEEARAAGLSRAAFHTHRSAIVAATQAGERDAWKAAVAAYNEALTRARSAGLRSDLPEPVPHTFDDVARTERELARALRGFDALSGPETVELTPEQRLTEISRTYTRLLTTAVESVGGALDGDQLVRATELAADQLAAGQLAVAPAVVDQAAVADEIESVPDAGDRARLIADADAVMIAVSRADGERRPLHSRTVERIRRTVLRTLVEGFREAWRTVAPGGYAAEATLTAPHPLDQAGQRAWNRVRRDAGRIAAKAATEASELRDMLQRSADDFLELTAGAGIEASVVLERLALRYREDVGRHHHEAGALLRERSEGDAFRTRLAERGRADVAITAPEPTAAQHEDWARQRESVGKSLKRRVEMRQWVEENRPDFRAVFDAEVEKAAGKTAGFPGLEALPEEERLRAREEFARRGERSYEENWAYAVARAENTESPLWIDAKARWKGLQWDMTLELTAGAFVQVAMARHEGRFAEVAARKRADGVSEAVISTATRMFREDVRDQIGWMRLNPRLTAAQWDEFDRATEARMSRWFDLPGIFDRRLAKFSELYDRFAGPGDGWDKEAEMASMRAALDASWRQTRRMYAFKPRIEALGVAMAQRVERLQRRATVLSASTTASESTGTEVIEASTEVTMPAAIGNGRARAEQRGARILAGLDVPAELRARLEAELRTALDGELAGAERSLRRHGSTEDGRAGVVSFANRRMIELVRELPARAARWQRVSESARLATEEFAAEMQRSGATDRTVLTVAPLFMHEWLTAYARAYGDRGGLPADQIEQFAQRAALDASMRIRMDTATHPVPPSRRPRLPRGVEETDGIVVIGNPAHDFRRRVADAHRPLREVPLIVVGKAGAATVERVLGGILEAYYELGVRPVVAFDDDVDPTAFDHLIGVYLVPVVQRHRGAGAGGLTNTGRQWDVWLPGAQRRSVATDSAKQALSTAAGAPVPGGYGDVLPDALHRWLEATDWRVKSLIFTAHRDILATSESREAIERILRRRPERDVTAGHGTVDELAPAVTGGNEAAVEAYSTHRAILTLAETGREQFAFDYLATATATERTVLLGKQMIDDAGSLPTLVDLANGANDDVAHAANAAVLEAVRLTLAADADVPPEARQLIRNNRLYLADAKDRLNWATQITEMATRRPEHTSQLEALAALVLACMG
jgi:hypothetical protein